MNLALSRWLSALAHLRGARLDAIVAVFTRSMGLVLSAGTILALTFLVSPVEQGYYFTFLSLAGFSQVADIGLTTVISLFVAHERAHLDQVNARSLVGPADRLGRIASLLRLSVGWYAALASILLVILWIGGWHLLKAGDDHTVHWQGPWLFAAVATALDFLTLPLIALLFGLGFIKSVYTLRALKATALAFTLWGALAAGAGLTAIGLSTLAGTIAVATCVFVSYGSVVRTLATRTTPVPVMWHAEILPMQWRIAISWLAGYFIFLTLTPIAFRLHGATLAGQIGATVGLFQAVLSLSVTVMESQQTKLGIMVAGKDPRLKRFALTAGATSVGLSCLGAAGCLILLKGGHILGLKFAERFLPIGLAAILLSGAIVQSLISAVAIYLRAHKREPFMWVSVLTGFVMVPTVFLGGLMAGDLGLVAAFTGVILAFSLPMTLFVLFRFQNIWHPPV